MATLDMIFTVFFSALAGYGFAKFNFKGRRILFIFVLSIMTIPFQILVVPLSIQMRTFGWDNSYMGLMDAWGMGLRGGLERTEKRGKLKVRELRVAGGGSQSDTALQITADIFGLPAAPPACLRNFRVGCCD